MAVCEWLLGPEVELPTTEIAELNSSEGSNPAQLAEMGGHGELARWLKQAALSAEA